MCALGRIRTCDLPFRRGLLYPLSYEGARPFGGPNLARCECSGRSRAVTKRAENSLLVTDRLVSFPLYEIKKR